MARKGEKMSTELSKNNTNKLDVEIIEKLVLSGDCSKMTPDQKIQYMAYRCNSLDIDLAEKPFEYIKLNGKEVLYATKACTDALCRTRKIRREVSSRDRIEDIYMVVARATDDTGRYDESIGAVAISNLKGDALANAIMKAETKAKRRAVLSLCGLGILDETELETIKEDKPVRNSEFKKLEEKFALKEKPLEIEKENDDLPVWNSESSDDVKKKVNEITLNWTHVDLPEYLTKNSEILNKFNGLQLYELSIDDAKSIYNELVDMEKKAKKEESKRFITEAKKQMVNSLIIISDMKKIGESNGTAKIQV